MKKTFYKIISVILCAVLLNITIISSMSVKSYCAIDIIQDFSQEAGEISSAFLGFVWDSAVDVGHNFLQFLGLETEEEQEEYLNNHYIIDDPAPGQAGHVKIDDTLKDDFQDYIDYYKENNPDFVYVYTTDIRRYINYFTNQSQYQAVVNFVRSKPLVFMYASSSASFNNTSNTGNTGIGFQEFGNKCLMLSYTKDTGVYCFVDGYGLQNLQNGWLSGCKPYKQNWEDFSGYSANWKTYAFSTNSDTTLSDISDIEWNFPNWWDRPYENGNYMYTREWTSTNQLNPFTGRSTPVTYGVKEFICFRNADIMKNYSAGTLSYYQVPTNPNVVYNDGYYSLTDSQLGDSITYGDITSYVETNNVSEYSTVINYINNYYSSGSGGSGSGGSGSGGDGPDIDWSWLGKIGEVIGGLISALGNVISGIIDGITSLITSLTENLPNVFSSIIEWLLPFVPEEVTSLISLLFMAIIIVGVVRLIRGK